MKLCGDHTASREFSWNCCISTEHLFERHIWGTAPASLTQNFVSLIRQRLPYDLCFIVRKKGFAIMIITDVTPLVF